MKATSEPIADDKTAIVCLNCKDAGYYTLDVPVGDPNFGVLMLCDCRRSEKEQRAAHELHRLSNLEPFSDKTFETFDASVPGVQRALARAREFARRPQGWLVFFGNYGCGKTHLAAAIANEALQNHYRVLFAVVPDLLDHLRSTFGPNSEIAYDERFEIVREAPMLILDDLGTENTTPWAREKLYQIINHRYNYCLPTVITSNRKPDEIEPRILSRMLDAVLCPERIIIEAGDYRRLPVEQRFGYRKRRLERGEGRDPRTRL
ncbi:MAG: ATP-binding protein [Chloroflexales bacterium]|nr:ATP-binding protein [Chloroflexales bacterium]